MFIFGLFEIVSRVLHYESFYCPVNCMSVDDNLQERSESDRRKERRTNVLVWNISNLRVLKL